MIPNYPVEYHHPVDETETRILDATLEALAAGQATMDDIAARADVGRVTLFRRFGSKEALLGALYVREVRQFLEHVDVAMAEFDDPADRIAAAFVACVREGARHPLLATYPPGAALEALAEGDPAPIELARRFVAARLEPGQEEAADLLVRLAITYVLVPSPVFDPGDERAARTFAHAWLAPIATASAKSARPAASGTPRSRRS
jgi:AcrR family transcriptional regulator